MTQPTSNTRIERATRRSFLRTVGQGTIAGGAAASLLGSENPSAAEPKRGKVAHRELGKTGLKISEIGFGGHSWSYARIPDGKGGRRKPTIDEAVEMIVPTGTIRTNTKRLWIADSIGCIYS